MSPQPRLSTLPSGGRSSFSPFLVLALYEAARQKNTTVADLLLCNVAIGGDARLWQHLFLGVTASGDNGNMCRAVLASLVAAFLRRTEQQLRDAARRHRGSSSAILTLSLAATDATSMSQSAPLDRQLHTLPSAASPRALELYDLLSPLTASAASNCLPLCRSVVSCIESGGHGSVDPLALADELDEYVQQQKASDVDDEAPLSHGVVGEEAAPPAENVAAEQAGRPITVCNGPDTVLVIAPGPVQDIILRAVREDETAGPRKRARSVNGAAPGEPAHAAPQAPTASTVRSETARPMSEVLHNVVALRCGPVATFADFDDVDAFAAPPPPPPSSHPSFPPKPTAVVAPAPASQTTRPTAAVTAANRFAPSRLFDPFDDYDSGDDAPAAAASSSATDSFPGGGGLRHKFSPEEDAALIEGVSKFHGAGRFRDILAAHRHVWKPSRTPQHLADHWKVLRPRLIAEAP